MCIALNMQSTKNTDGFGMEFFNQIPHAQLIFPRFMDESTNECISYTNFSHIGSPIFHNGFSRWTCINKRNSIGKWI